MFIRTMLLLCLISGAASAAQGQQETSPTISKSEITTNSTVQSTNTDTEAAKTLTTSTALNTQKNTRSDVDEAAFDAHDLSPIGMYKAADVVVKSVIIGLLLASLTSWAICIFKSVQLNFAKRHAKKLLTHLIKSESFAKAKQNLSSQQSNALTLLKATEHELQLTAEGLATDGGLKERLIARLERVQASINANMNQGTGMLATIGSVAPFVGLFGTVWGIMNSFIGIAKTQTTNLAVVAPGIAEALLATALGLVAAIPAVVMYNHFSRVIGSYKAQLADIHTAIMILVSRDLDREHPDAKQIAYLLSDKEAADAPAKRA